MKASLQVYNDIKYLPVCTSFADSFASLGIDDPVLGNQVVLAVEEAFCHTVEHAYEPGETGEVSIDAEFQGKNLQISFRDTGLPFDRTLLDNYDPRSAAASDDLKGLSLFLLQKAADEVRWEHLGREGNLMRITFMRKGEDVTQSEGGSELKVLAPDVALAPEQNYVVRLATPDAAIHISRCIYRAYGYTYASEDMYYPERIQQMIRSGDLISAVTVAENGEIVGHVSLAAKVRGVLVESGQAVVNPAHRGRNLLEKMKDLLNAHGAKIGLRGICSEPVANHLRSQKTSLKTGNKSCGLVLGLAPESMSFKKLGTSAHAQRISTAYNYMHLSGWYDKTVYLTEEFASLVADIYAGNSLPVKLDTSAHAPAQAGSRMNSRFIKPLNIGWITVEDVGGNCGDMLKQGLLQLTMKTGASIVYLDLPLENEACALAVAEARKLGFVFCALAIAADNGRDFLRMQYVNCDMDYSQIQLAGDMAAKIFSFVLKQLGVELPPKKAE